jgi:excisionase family DNA binding protein
VRTGGARRIPLPQHRLDGKRRGVPIEVQKMLLRPEDAAEVMSLSRSAVYKLIREGRLRSIKEGKRRIIPAEAIREFIEDQSRPVEAHTRA